MDIVTPKIMCPSDCQKRDGSTLQKNIRRWPVTIQVLETVTEPEAIYEGKTGECLAIREIERGKHIVVVYRELGKEDGFIVTAFLTKRKGQDERGSHH